MKGRREALGISVAAAVLLCGACGSVRAADAQTWQPRPAPADATRRPQTALIVDFGGELTRGSGYPQTGFGTRRPGHRYMNYSVERTVDVDGDGSTEDDCVGYWPFSMDQPLSPMPIPRGGYMPDLTSSVFYGGLAGFWANRTEPDFRECGCNPEHDGPFHDPRADDFAYHTYSRDPDRAIKHRAYGLWMFKKGDFLNGGDSHRVTFDDDSRIAVLIARYWTNFEEGRYVVQDGDEFYISEFYYRGLGDPPNHRNWNMGRAHICRPTQTRWALYNPRDYRIAFRPQEAQFSEYVFREVRAVGWYVGRNNLYKGNVSLKWYNFEVEAAVHRPQRPSESIEMARVPAGDDVPSFYISTCEVPYALWQRIYHWSTAPTYAMKPNYVFDRDGAMGSMRLGRYPHDPDEPVTDMPFLDALASCNALSEREGREPCYYTDSERTRVFRNAHLATTAEYEFGKKHYERSELIEHPLPTIHVKWSADGYRLPTATEYERVAEGVDPAVAWTSANGDGTTHPVGGKVSGDYGLSDLTGNVWEYVWPAEGAFDSAGATELTVVGGGIEYPEDPAEEGASPFTSRPWRGTWNIGFRLVRRERGGGPPLLDGATGGLPSWTFGRDERIGGGANAPAEATPTLDLVRLDGGTYTRPEDSAPITVSPYSIARTEVTYEQWREAYHWGLDHGYEFDRDGDMGSMDDEQTDHTPDEPVTDITWYDCIVWCNALSEMEGLTPCYYADEAREEVFRSVLAYRPWKPAPDGDGIIRGGTEAGRVKSRGLLPAVHVRWHADGYRLPTKSEWQFAYKAGTQTRYFWGNDLGEGESYAWFSTPERDLPKTQPVGLKEPNPFGLYDMAGNVFEWCWYPGPGYESNYYDQQNPKYGWAWPVPTRKGGSIKAMGGSYFSHNTSFLSGQGGLYGNVFLSFRDFGFRPVRCEAGTHPEGKPELEPPTVLDVHPGDYAMGQGQLYRANVHRTGTFESTGVKELTGEKWVFKTGGPVRSSPVCVDGTVYVGSDDGNFYAIDAGTGEEKWRLETGRPVVCSAAVADERVYIGSDNGTLYALDAQSGEVAWQARGTRAVQGSPLVAYGVVFTEVGGTLRGFDARTGEEVWHYRMERGRLMRHAALALYEGTLLWGQHGNEVMAADVRTEWKKWTAHPGDGGWYATPAAGDGVAYFGNAVFAGLAAVEVETGQVLWRSCFAPDDPKSLRAYSSPALAKGRLYMGDSEGRLRVLDAADGTQVGSFQAKDAINSSPAVGGGVVYFGCDDGRLYAVDAESMQPVWSFQTEDKITSSPWVGDGVIYVGSDDGRVYAVH